MLFELVHGGTDALGVPAHDFSTNRNACGPCPQVVQALHAANTAQYPDPAYTQLRAQLADFHGVDAARIVIAGSASEWIHRISMHAARCGAEYVTLPPHRYGDYPHAAALWRLQPQDRTTQASGAGLHWACAPSSPLGQEETVWPHWALPAPPNAWRVLDCAYAPLRLEHCAAQPALDHVWQMWTPNKALGMTGIRAAYVIAPLGCIAQAIETLRTLVPSWVVGAHGVAMLQAWTSAPVQDWLAQSLQTLRGWKTQQLALCEALGWDVIAGHQANYWVARWPADCQGEAMAQRLQALRAHGIKLRDCHSFGLPGHVRMGVLPPASQQALRDAWQCLQ